MEVKKKSRDSNFEAMRILSMFFIVMYHIFVHGKVLEHDSGMMEVILTFIESLLLVCVNSFILVTGYFQCEKDIHASKVIKLINQTWFYKVVIMFALVLCGIIMLPDNLTIIRILFPIDNGTYWYINCYILLYLISPLLNKIINNSNKKEFTNIIILLFIILSVLPTLSKDVYFNAYTGRDLSTFILLYFIGAYLKKYPLEKSKLMKKHKNKSKIIYFGGFVAFALISTIASIIYNKLSTHGAVLSELGRTFGYLHISYASPILVIESICYFLFFKTLSFKSKFIEKVSACTLGVYLISENIFIRENLYRLSGLTEITTITPKLVLILFLVGILIYIICTIIEFIRQSIFKFIYKSDIAGNYRTWYRKKVAQLGININW